MRRFCTLDHGNHYQTILAVEADDGSLRLLMPFAGQSIAKAAMVDDDRIFCLAQDGACCLLDWRSGRELASGRTRNPHADVMVTRDARCVVLYSGAILHVLRADDLTTAIEADAVRWLWGGRQGRLVDSHVHTSAGAAGGLRQFQPTTDSWLHLHGPLIEDAAGQLLIQLYEQKDNEGKRYGLYHIDPESWTIRLDLAELAYDYPIFNPFRWFSPSGRYAARWPLGSLAYDSGARVSLFGFGKRTAPKHRDALADGNKRFGLALEIWSTDPLAFQTSVVTRLQTLYTAADNEFWQRQGRECAENFIRFAGLAAGDAPRPRPPPQAMPSFFLNATMPDIALRQWQLLRRRLLEARTPGHALARQRFWRVDTGNYRFSRAAAFAGTALAAVEMGDREVADLCLAALEEECPALVEADAWYRPNASVWAHAVEFFARSASKNGFRHLIDKPRDRAPAPMISDIAYPDILVARAGHAHRMLTAVLYPGERHGRFRFRVSGLAPEASYVCDGTEQPRIRSDRAGEAIIKVALIGRTEIRIRPAA